MVIEEKIKQAEAVIFASGDGISLENLKQVLEIDSRQLRFIIDNLKEKYNSEDSGITLYANEGSLSFGTSRRLSTVVHRALSVKKNSPLSAAAMETLAIIAYNQPVSRAFVEQVRGVDSSSSVQTLLSRGLIEEAGRLDIPGKPLSYKTTAVFLRSFSLNDLSELPKVKAEREEGQISTDDLPVKEDKDELDS